MVLDNWIKVNVILDKIRDKKIRYYLNKKTTRIFLWSSSEIDKS